MQRTEPVVDAFASLMKDKLRENSHKGGREGWLADSPEDLFNRLLDEAIELRNALRIRQALPSPSAVFDPGASVAREAADVANFAMMIADVCGGLNVKLRKA